MKNFSKLLSKNNLIIIAIFLVAVFVRFYNFPNRVTFWTEQAESLTTSLEYLKKPTLLGQEYFRKDLNGHVIFSGALFNYLLLPLALISNLDPVKITAFFAVLNIATGFAIFVLIKKMFGEKLAAVSTFLFLFNDYMIYHSLFIWNYNFLPLIGIFIFYFTRKNFKKESPVNFFLLGLFNGFGISLQILFVILALAVFLINILKVKSKINFVVMFLAGIILGNLPMIIFDLRHNFYQTQTLWNYLTATFAGKTDASFSYYYLLPFWPIFAVILGYFFLKFFKVNKYLGFALLIFYIFINLTSQKINWNFPTGMPKGIRVSDIDRASRAIAADAKNNFNVSEVLDFDKRAYVFRYFLVYKYRKEPMRVADYPEAQTLSVLSEVGYHFKNSGVWEVKSGGLTEIKKLADVNGGYAIYKLTK